VLVLKADVAMAIIELTVFLMMCYLGFLKYISFGGITEYKSSTEDSTFSSF